MARVTKIPNTERDTMLAGIATLERMMPASAKLAMTMRKEFVKAGFSKDEALTLVAYSLFRK
jgi:hypothetical protein